MKNNGIRVFRTTISLVLFLVLVMPSVFAKGNQDAEVEKPELVWLTSVQGGREPEENALFEAEVERLTGIKVKIIKPPGSEYNTKLTAMLATGEPLDIAYMGSSVLAELLDQDLLEPLTDRVKASSILSDPSIIAPSEWDRVQESFGEIYGVFNKFEQGTLPTVRADWLENLGLDDPVTLDDYYEVLKAFTFNDPDGNGKDDTYGMSIGYTLYDISSLFGAYGLVRGYAKDSAGNLYSPFATEAAIPVYEFLAKIYREGILGPNFITNNSGAFRDMFMTDKAGMTFYWAAWVGLFNKTVSAENPASPFRAKALTPPKGPDGSIICRAGDDGFMVIPRNSKYKDEAFKILEFWHTYEGNIISTLGIEGHDYNMNGDNYDMTEIGNAHARDHGAPQPKSLAWKNPFGELEGFDDAAEIIRKYGIPQMITPHNKAWEEISRSEAARIILGEITPEEGIKNMNRRFKDEGIF